MGKGHDTAFVLEHEQTRGEQRTPGIQPYTVR